MIKAKKKKEKKSKLIPWAHVSVSNLQTAQGPAEVPQQYPEAPSDQRTHKKV